MPVSFPASRRARVVARREPSASPSGFSCVTTRNRSCDRTASTTAWISVGCVVSVIVGLLWFGKLRRELVDQLRHPDPALDRVIVGEGQRRGPAKAELPVDPCLQHAAGRLETGECLAAALVAA